MSYNFDVFITRSLVKGLVKLDFIQSGMNDCKVPVRFFKIPANFFFPELEQWTKIGFY